MSWKEIFGVIATVIAFISYIPYFRDIIANKTKPHAFSWLVWSLLTGIGFFAQLTGGAGAGAWVTGFTAVICFVIFILGILKGRKNIVLIDWFCLAGAGIAFIMYVFIREPIFSVVLITITDILGSIPTIRKSYNKPYEETLSTFFLSGLKFVFALFALNKFSIVTALYPFAVVVKNWLFVSMLIIRKRQLQK